jgi:hypothetical protein
MCVDRGIKKPFINLNDLLMANIVNAIKSLGE